jgi:putative hemolysin
MDSHRIGQLALLLGLILLNGIFSMSETAIISARRVRLQQRAEAGDERAQVALGLIAHPDRFLSTVQIGITLIGVLSGAIGETSLGQPLAEFFVRLGLAKPLAETVGFTVGIILITYFSLVLGELVPKTLALANAENLSARVAKPMQLLSKVATPLVWLLSVSTRGLLRLMGIRPSDEPPVTQDEIKSLIEQGTKAGVFDEGEQEIVERLFRAADRRITSVMTPRREISYLDIEDTWEVNAAKIASVPHTAFPVCVGGLDDLIGIVPLKALWWAAEQHQGTIDLRSLAQEPLFLMEHRLALEALEEFRRSSRSLGLVVDEYGNTVGLITLHDLLEALVGEIGTDGAQKQDLSVVKRDDGSWLLDGMLPVDEFVHVLDLRDLPQDSRDYATLGGFVMARLGRIPSSGDHFTWSEFRFEVMDMDGHRVDKVLVSALPPQGAPTT